MGLKVTITPAVGSPVTICDAPDPLPSFGFTMNRREILRVQPTFRAAYQTVFDQKNRVNRVSFNVTRNTDASGGEFKSAVDALAFCFDHPDLVPTSGVATFTLS